MTSIPYMPVETRDVVYSNLGKPKNNTMLNPDYPCDFGVSEQKTLPSTAKRLYGCINCEWRSTPLCLFGFKVKKDPTQQHKNMHTNGICQERINWLMSFSRSDSKSPSYTEWKDDFNDAMGQVQMHKDYHRLRELELKLISLETTGARHSTIKDYNQLRKEARDEWFEMWSSLRKFTGDKLNREATHKVEVDMKQVVRIHDINKIIREGRELEVSGMVVDADITEVTDTANEEKKEGEDDTGRNTGVPKTETK